MCPLQSDVSVASSAVKGLPPGYVWASGEGEPLPPSSSGPTSLVMSPKRLQVESHSPYSKAITSVQGGRSSMV